MEGNGGEGAAAEGSRRSPRVEVPKGSKKADLQKLAKDALKLPMSKEPTPLLALPAPPTCNSTVAAGQPGPSSAAVPDAPHGCLRPYILWTLG
eukprot:Em0032g12a